MTYLSVCSGIEAATVAWHGLMEPVAFSEIESFASAVLAHHYPDVPNLGDMTKYKEWQLGAVDVLVGGTPCQSFSVAGLRQGLDDPRGNLMLVYLGVVERVAPRWIVWENVPGVLSSHGGRDFGTFLGALGKLGYGWAYATLDAQYFGVPQRRRRVFVVGYLGDWRPPAAVLFEPESLRGDSAPSREAGARVALPVTSRVDRGGEHREAHGNNLVASKVAGSVKTRGGNHAGQDADGVDNLVAATLNSGGNNGGFRTEPGEHLVAGPLKARSVLTGKHDADGAAGGHLVVPFDTTQITSKGNYSNPKAGDPMHPLAKGQHPPAVAIQDARGVKAQNGRGWNDDGSAYTHDTANVQAVAVLSSVRRLTPRECERLQGFPDDYTLVPYPTGRRKTKTRPAADGPRYRALGNSMAVPVMRWIGRRIVAADLVKHEAV